jgi:hypothetical protein
LHGYHLAEPDFDVVREADKEIAALHKNVVDSGKYPGLERVSKADEVEGALRRGEASHQEQCRWVQDNGKFFCWNQVGGARLAAASVCVYVPAVREAREDAAERKGSALSTIVDLVLCEELRLGSSIESARSSRPTWCGPDVLRERACPGSPLTRVGAACRGPSFAGRCSLGGGPHR